MPLSNLITGLLRPAVDVVRIFKGDKSKREAAEHAQTMALLQTDQASLAQFAAEFRPLSRRTGWDSFIDGLNRLPRPLMAFSVIGLFFLAAFAPERFAEIAMALQLVPDGMWGLLALIAGFYFGGRMQAKARDFALPPKALAAFRPQQQDPETGNAVIKAWRAQRG